MDPVDDFSTFVDIGGSITSFLFSAPFSTQALGVNDLGNTVGNYTTPNGDMFGFLDVDGTFTKLDLLLIAFP